MVETIAYTILKAAGTTLEIITISTLLTGYLEIKSQWFRKLVDSEPVTMIQNGEIINENMKKTRFAIDDLMMKLREKNIFNIADVEFALLEHDGKLSVQPKSQNQPLTPSDMNLPSNYKGLTTDSNQ